MGPDTAALDTAEMHGPGNLEVLDVPPIDFVKTREPGGRKILVMVQPVPRLLIGIEQTLRCNVVGVSGISVGHTSGCGKPPRQHACAHNSTAAFEACHGCISYDVTVPCDVFFCIECPTYSGGCSMLKAIACYAP